MASGWAAAQAAQDKKGQYPTGYHTLEEALNAVLAAAGAACCSGGILVLPPTQ